MNTECSTGLIKLKRGRTIEILGKLESVSKAGKSIYLPPGSANDSLSPDIDTNLPDQLKKAARKSATGFVLFLNVETDFIQFTLVIPPFPVHAKTVVEYIDIQPLEELISTDYLTGVILVRMGSFAVGVVRGDKIISSKISGGCIHGRHRQGGSSAARFARHREKQIEQFFTRACGYTREHIEPCAHELDYIIYGGAWTTINAFKKQCSVLSRITTPELAPLLDIGQPRQQVLGEAVTLMYSSRVAQWRQAKST